MSIAILTTPRIRPYRGFEDPALPDGFWVVHASVLGDGSGGLQEIVIRFSSALEPAPSAIWNVEQLVINHTGLAGTVTRIDFGNMDRQAAENSTGALQKLFAFRLLDFGASFAGSAIDFGEKLNLPLFLGSSGKQISGDLSFDAPNVTATSFSVNVQGYFWGPGAINAPGGPQRPANSLYGR